MAQRSITAYAVTHDILRRDEYTPDLVDRAEMLEREEKLLQEVGGDE